MKYFEADAVVDAVEPGLQIGVLFRPTTDTVLVGGTMPARSLCRMPKAVSYRVSAEVAAETAPPTSPASGWRAR